MRAGLEGDAKAFEQASKANREFAAKVVPVLKWIWVAELAVYLIVTLLATLLYLRFSRLVRSDAI